MSVICEYFGKNKNQEDVLAFRLQAANGAYVRVLNRGGIIQSICVPDRNGKLTDVILGFDTMEEYDADTSYQGALVGRVANRIAGSGFELNDKTYTLAANNGVNALHGGIVGYTHRIWDHKIENDALVLSLFSPDGEEGFPGNLNVQVTYTFSDDCRLRIAYRASGDADTIINLTNHAYFNLNGSGDVLSHVLRIDADAYTPSGEGLIPTGEIAAVAGTPLDFRIAKPIGKDIAAEYPQISLAGGYDHNYVLNGKGVSAYAYAPESGISMTLSTDLPGVQLYTGNGMSKRAGKAGTTMDRFGGFCLETQYYPDSIHQPAFPSVILKAGEIWDHYAEFAFAVEA